MIHDRDDPRIVCYRSEQPILEPETVEERVGVVGNVVFPTGLDPRPDGAIDIYYGAADAAIGVARMTINPPG